MQGFLNIGSLILGIIALALPIMNLVKYKNDKHKNWSTFSIMSAIACATAVYFQLYASYNLIKIADWAALDDTIGATTFIALVLLVVTITLNAVVVFLYHEKVEKQEDQA